MLPLGPPPQNSPWWHVGSEFPSPGPSPSLPLSPCYHHTAIQAWKQLSYPQCINQKFKAATYHNDSLFTYDKNQRGAEIPSILRGVSPARTGYAARVRAEDL